MKKGTIGKLALIAGGLYAAKAIADKKSEETALSNIFGGLTQNATPDTNEIPFSPDEFKKWLDANPTIKAALKGAAGEAGSNGSNGVDGNQIQNFGGSLLVNGAGELGNTNNNRGTSYSLINNVPCFSVPEGAYFYNDTKIKFVKDRLYRVRMKVKGTGNLYVLVTNSDINNQPLTRTFNNYPGAYPILGAAVTNTFEEVTAYCGATNNAGGASHFHESTEFINSFAVYLSGGGFVHSTIFELVKLGEAVPSNLPWLPTGQEVYDTTTGDRGRYNGTAVDWYTML